jgi:diketogulonate reductase-like aldo/keto reductase
MTPQSTIELRSGNSMPVLGLGTWQLTKNTEGTVEQAIALGFRMIDTSGDYGTQPGIGAALKHASVDRDQIYIVTKVEETDDAYEATRKDLDELQLDHANLMLIHRPPDKGAGEALWDGLIRAREDRLTRDIGVSNYSVKLMDRLSQETGETPAVNQIEWSPFGHSDEMQRYCQEHGIVIQAYSPLTRTRRLNDKRLQAIAARYDKTPAQVMIRWNLQRGTVPLPKANQIKHAKEDIDVFDFDISAGDMDTLNKLNEHYSSLGKLAYH